MELEFISPALGGFPGFRDRVKGSVKPTRRHPHTTLRAAVPRRKVRAHPQATDPLRLAIEAIPVGMILVDGPGRIVLANALIEKLFGYAREELIGQPVETLVPQRFRAYLPAFRAEFFAHPEPRPMRPGGDLFGLRKDGSWVPVEIGLNPFRNGQGAFVLCSVVDITERKHGERERDQLLVELRALNAELEARVDARTSELMAALHEREVLLQEVHHRVKNNLQVISSLINMQARSLRECDGRDALVECQTRVQAIALIHQELYRTRNYAQVPFSEYARNLAENVFRASGSPAKVSLELAIDDVALAVDKAIPCGLILNELITNSIKHAFPDGRLGTIRVEVGPARDGRLRLSVIDDGVGLPPGVEAPGTSALGLQLVRMLAEQLGAHLDAKGAHGTFVRLTVPMEE